MKLITLLPLAVLAADAVVASLVPAHHQRLARRANRKKRCIARNTSSIANNNLIGAPTVSSSATPAPAPSSTEAPPPPPASTKQADPPAADPNPPAQQHQSGTINVASSCGDIGASSEPSNDRGPNGSIYWLNCGIDDGSGWRPPYFGVNDVVAQDLGTVLSWGGNPFESCRPFLDKFYAYGGQYNVPPILLASIAMQESSCNPNAVGGNGEQGLMQITVDKCPGGYGGGACTDPDYNIRTGASYLKGVLDSVGGSLPEALGMYNGWRRGMTKDDATRARSMGMCFAQNNLDYLHQTFNGWLQGVAPSSRGLGVYFNLSGC